MICELPMDPFLKELSGTTWLLTLVTPCNTQGQDAIQEHMTYSTQAVSIITDIRLIQAVIGQVHSHTEWVIIDHSPASSHAAFAVDDIDNSDDELL